MDTRSQKLNKKRRWFAWLFGLLVGVIVLYGGYQGYVLTHNFNAKVDQAKSNKNVKQVYNEAEDGPRAVRARKQFNAVYYRYVTKNGLDLKNRNKHIPLQAVDEMQKNLKHVGYLEKQQYHDRWQELELMAKMNNAYLKLWAQTGQKFKTETVPGDIYQFNNKYADSVASLQSMRANSKYASYITEQMNKMGDDAGNVQSMAKTFNEHFKVHNNGWKVNHSYDTDTLQTILNQKNSLNYRWPIIAAMDKVVQASQQVAAANEVNNKQIAEIESWNKAQTQAQTDARKQAQDAVSSAQKASSSASSSREKDASSAKSASEAAQKSENSSSSNSTSSSSTSSSSNN